MNRKTWEKNLLKDNFVGEDSLLAGLTLAGIFEVGADIKRVKQWIGPCSLGELAEYWSNLKKSGVIKDGSKQAFLEDTKGEEEFATQFLLLVLVAKGYIKRQTEEKK